MARAISPVDTVGASAGIHRTGPGGWPGTGTRYEHCPCDADCVCNEAKRRVGTDFGWYVPPVHDSNDFVKSVLRACGCRMPDGMGWGVL
jgi:hypothetical protein